MTPERWQQVEEVLQSALDLPEAERAELLAKACGGDLELQNQTASLIAAYEAADDFLERPALERDAHVLIDDDNISRIGAAIGPYKIIECLGSGGMGEVYLAADERLGRRVAVKILPSYFVSDSERLRRFQTEARAASALNHTNILTVYEVGESDGTHFIATEFIDGQTIRELIESENLTLGEVFDIVTQLVSGLAAAHAAGIVHRDIKPDNIMRRKDGVVKILDFGIAKLLEGSANEVSTLASSRATNRTDFGALLGTIGYISPEQARGFDVDERTDIWSCGVVLYELLSAERPFAGATNADTIVSILEREPAPLFSASSVPMLRLMQRITDKALSKNVEDRYRAAAEMLKDLNAARAELEAASSAAHPPIDHNTSVREIPALANALAAPRPRNFLALVGSAMLVVLLIAGAVLYQRSRPRLPVNPTPQKTYAQMNDAEQLGFVSEQEQRIAAMMGDRPVKLNDEALRAIKAQVDSFVSRRRDPDHQSLAEVYRRAPPYIPVIARAFAARRIPVVIAIYLPMIESAYKPCYVNSAGAKGLFQFLPVTAEQYGVARADMCDVDKMAPAAAHYIADRMAELGDDSQSMTLVLLSYNRGPDSVRDSLRLLRETDSNYERNFWTLFANRDKLDEAFRQESAGYVPAFFAAAIIGENPEAFELQLPPLTSFAN